MIFGRKARRAERERVERERAELRQEALDRLGKAAAADVARNQARDTAPHPRPDEK
jgi:hypothetical protein